MIERRNCKRWSDLIMSKLMMVVFFAGTAAYAVGAPADTPAWVEHWDLARVLVAALFAIIAFFLIHTLNKFDRNQDAIFSRLSSAEKDIAKLRGRCEAMLRCSDREAKNGR